MPGRLDRTGIDNSPIVYLPMRGLDTPTPEDVAAVAGTAADAVESGVGGRRALAHAGQGPGMMRHGLFMVAFGIVTPVVFATIGIGFATVMGLSPGGSILLAVLAGSASYISVPAAMRAAVPEANPALPLTASLAITFPFNILVGIPLYHRMVMAWTGA